MSNVEQENQRINEEGLDLLFRTARSYNSWQDKAVSEELLREIYDLFKFGPTSANASPARILFLTSTEAKERLAPTLAPQNVQKSLTAPVVALIAHDEEFYEKLPKLFPHADARAWFANSPERAQETAFRNSTLQGAYFMLAARALGLDCGPMSGFDKDKVDAEFFSEGTWKINFICNLGYGGQENLFARSPRLDFDEACMII